MFGEPGDEDSGNNRRRISSPPSTLSLAKGEDWHAGLHGHRSPSGRATLFYARYRIIFLGAFLDLLSVLERKRKKWQDV